MIKDDSMKQVRLGAFVAALCAVTMRECVHNPTTKMVNSLVLKEVYAIVDAVMNEAARLEKLT